MSDADCPWIDMATLLHLWEQEEEEPECITSGNILENYICNKLLIQSAYVHGLQTYLSGVFYTDAAEIYIFFKVKLYNNHQSFIVNKTKDNSYFTDDKQVIAFIY